MGGSLVEQAAGIGLIGARFGAARNRLGEIVEGEHDPSPILLSRPLRLMLGADAIAAWEKKEAAFAAELERWRSVGEATAAWL